MQTMAIINGFIHIMATVIVVGGVFFNEFIVKRAVKEIPPAEGGRVKGTIGSGFSIVVWLSIVLILVTGVARSLALNLFNSDVLVDTVYGNLLVAKIVLFAVIIFNGVMIARTAMKMMKLSEAGGPPPADQIRAFEGRIRAFSLTNLTISTIVIFLAVWMRVLGAPGG